MNASQVFRWLSLVIVGVFIINLAILCVYFPIPQQVGFLDRPTKNGHSGRNLHLWQTQHHHLTEAREDVPPNKKLVTSVFPKTNHRSSCPIYGCPIYPPELTNAQTNKTIAQSLSTDYNNEWKKPPFFATEAFATLTQQGKSHTINQDRAVFISPYYDRKDSFLACIFDGHGRLGHKVAQELVEGFPTVLHERLSQTRRWREMAPPVPINEGGLVAPKDYNELDRVIVEALFESFLQVNDQGDPTNFVLGGSTATVAVKWGSRLYLANAGDSKSLLVSISKEKPLQTSLVHETKRHKANQPEERERIEKLGGKIHVNSKGFDPRVILYSPAANDTIGLAMSRSIGDWEWKQVGVTAEPTIDVLEVSGNSTFLVLASDGFWDMRRERFFAQHLAPSFFERPHQRPLSSLYDIIQKITPKQQTGYRDDITATIVKIE